MRIAVLSDSHANRWALEAVQRHLDDARVERVWFLGDAVGYGPHPVSALTHLRQAVAPADWVLGNHDVMLADALTPLERSRIHPVALEAIDLNRAAIARDAAAQAFWQTEFRPERERAQVHTLGGLDHVLIHASQVGGVDRYVYSWSSDIYLEEELVTLSTQALAAGRPRLQWYGHTHVPALIRTPGPGAAEAAPFEAIKVLPGETYALDGRPTLINPGSVGQPRDLDRRAAYALYDSAAHSVVFHRVDYDWRDTAGALLAQGYPESLAARLQDARLVDSAPLEWRAHLLRARTMAYDTLRR